MLCATFPDVPVIAMTATATKGDREDIKKSLDMKECCEIVGNPDRQNITYEKHFRVGSDVDLFMSILTPMAQGLLQQTKCYSLTIVYLPLKWCGCAYKIFESVLGQNQYYPEGSMPIPENRLFAQFHLPQTKEMKDQILKQLCSSESTVRVVFATVALGMGVDIRDVRCIVDISPPYTIQAYFQETAELGGMDSLQLLFFFITTVILLETNLGCKKKSGSFAKAWVNALDIFCCHYWTQTKNISHLSLPNTFAVVSES